MAITVRLKMIKYFSIFILIILEFSVYADNLPTGSNLIKSNFSLIDENNNKVTQDNYKDQYTLIFFGFSYCAKICPLGLQKMSDVLKKLASDAELITPLFISVDPERDTPERLKKYTDFFNPKLIGLTGKKEEIENVTKSFRAYYRKISGQKEDEYEFDHSSIIYLMNRNGEYLYHLSSVNNTDEVVKEIKNILNKELN